MRVLRAVACAATLILMGPATAHAGAADASTDPGAALRARFAALKDELGRNQFDRPIHMISTEAAESVTGEIYAHVNHAFATAGTALTRPAQWCAVMILHLNTKYCRPSTGGPATILHVNIGKKHDQPIDETYRVDFDYRVVTATRSYLQVKLDAAEGPLGTRNYRIVLEATTAPGGQTFIRLSYSYTYGAAGQLAMRAYFGTAGRNKVGFTVVGQEAGGAPLYIGGMRGLVERNTMRYYLAIEAYLGALSAVPDARLEKSLRDWHAAVERYPRQLHEMERGEYLAMKRREYSRQQTGPRPGTG